MARGEKLRIPRCLDVREPNEPGKKSRIVGWLEVKEPNELRKK